jgi:hypothetical protein
MVGIVGSGAVLEDTVRRLRVQERVVGRLEIVKGGVAAHVGLAGIDAATAQERHGEAAARGAGRESM